MFGSWMHDLLWIGVLAEAADSAAAAVTGADIVVVATRSEVPVLSALDVCEGAHVVTVGPKFLGAHELPLELLDITSVITCDSTAQANAYPEPCFTGPRKLTGLGEVLAGTHAGRASERDITLQCSVRLAGTEVLLANLLMTG